MTRIERLLGATEGDEVSLPVDLIVSDDWTTPALLPPLNALGTMTAAAPIVLVRDHTREPERYVGEDRTRVERLREIEEQFVRRFDAQRLTGRGIQHHALPEAGLLREGMVVLGNDSHTPTLGAYGVTAFAGQPTTVAVAIHTGHLVLRVPRTVRVLVTGELRAGASIRDASLTLLHLLRAGGPVPRLATGKALEFAGRGLKTLSPSQRAVLANCTPEAAAITATFPRPDEPEPDEPAPVTTVHLDLATVEPSVARSGNSADVVPLPRLTETVVHRVFVGTCAGGTFEEISDFAAALSSEDAGKVAVPTTVAPASRSVDRRLREAGIIDRLELAGVEVMEPGCGPCFGFGIGRLRDAEVAVVTGNRNGIGRMGSPSSHIHLASGRTAGLAARTGRLGSATANVETLAHTGCRVTWPRHGNVVRLGGIVSTDDLTPSALPGVGTSSDTDPAILRRLLLAKIDASAGERDLSGTVFVADENFGLGSNRASSVRALLAAGVTAVIAKSVAPLYELGARDEGLAVITVPNEEFYRLANEDALVTVDLADGMVAVNGREFRFDGMGAYGLALHASGGAVEYLRGSGAVEDLRSGGSVAHRRSGGD